MEEQRETDYAVARDAPSQACRIGRGSIPLWFQQSPAGHHLGAGFDPLRS